VSQAVGQQILWDASRIEKMLIPKSVRIPKSGAVFLTHLSDGRFGAIRILRDTPPEDSIQLCRNHVFVGVSTYIDSAKAIISDPRLREIIRLNHHLWKNAYAVAWIPDPIPDDFQYIGEILPSPDEIKINHLGFARGWKISEQVLFQWRWDNERDLVLQEDAKKQEFEKLEKEKEELLHQRNIASMTLEKLKNKRRFVKWKRLIHLSNIEATRAIFDSMISELVRAGENPEKSRIQQIFTQCVEEINRLDEEKGYFIETEEREDILKELIEIGLVCGLPSSQAIIEIADEHRKW
jgi:hypothetical protein